MAGGLFHLGLFVVLILGTAHMLVWKSLLGFGWPTLPLPIVDWLTAGAIIAMIALFINRANVYSVNAPSSRATRCSPPLFWKA